MVIPTSSNHKVCVATACLGSAERNIASDQQAATSQHLSLVGGRQGAAQAKLCLEVN